MKKFIHILVLLLFSTAWAQTYQMTAANNGQTIVTCAGTFTDDGGPTGNYSNNIYNRTITFCTANPGELLRFNFTSFYTENNYDVLEVFQGPIATGQPAATYSNNLGAFIFMSNQPGGCVTFRFNSDGSVNHPGWSAGISCVVPCTPPTAVLVDSSTIDLCSTESTTPGDLTVQFDASGSFSNDSYTISKYEWNWGDGTTSTTTTPVTTHTFPDDPGIYTVSLKVRTFNTGTDPLGCLSSNTAVKLIKLLPPPNFGGTTFGPLEISCGESVTLTGIGGSQIITQEPPPNVGTEISLPDGDGVSYYSYLDLTGYFPPGATMTNTCFPEIMIELEHSFAGDLWIDLIAPSGQEVRLFNGYGPFGGQKFGWCVNGADNLQPGCVAPYYIVNSGGINWGAAGGYTNATQTCAVYPGPCESGQYFLQGETFNSSGSMNSLIGAELNGIWVLKISDEWAIDDGFISTWSISFPGDCYADLATETPLLSGGLWTSDGNGPDVPGTQNVQDIVITPIGLDPCPGEANCDGNMLTNTIQVGPFNQAGTFTYTFTVTDEFGCTFVKTVDVIVDGVETEFDAMTEEYCLDSTADELPTISANGVEGTWLPATIDTSTVGGPTEYIFTPNDDECGTQYSVFITITDLEEASFAPIQLNYCQLEVANALPTNSLEGYAGTWLPAVISTDEFGTATYVFTPNDPCVAPFEVEITVEERITPTFPDLAVICQNTTAPALPLPNEAGITGTWFPATIDTSLPIGDYEFTFTPAAGVCASEQTITISISEELPVELNLQQVYCQGETAETLPLTLDNGITGVWIPAVIDTNAVGTSTYTFLPDVGQCAMDTPVEITVNPDLLLNTLPTQLVCDDDFDGILEFNLTTLNAGLTNVNGVSFQYYGSATDLTNNNPIPQNQWLNYPITGTLPATIWIVGTTADGCPSDPISVQVDQRDIATHNPGTYGPIEFCVGETIDLTQYEGNISNAAVTFNYFETLQNAQNGAGAIQNLTEYNGTSTTIFVRIEQTDRCPAFVEIELEQLPTPSLDLSEYSVILCYEDSREVTATSDVSNATFEWTLPDGTIVLGPTQTVSDTGTYSVIAYSPDDCESVERTITVSLPTQPIIMGIDATGNSITISATNNGEGSMEYSLDGTFWQSSPLFSNLIAGESYTVWVRSRGCMIEKYDVTLIFVPNFISPNNDGINDTWTIRGIEASPNSTLKIFDRYGKIFVDTNFDGNYTWNGKYLGNNVPSGDYWYIIQIPGNEMIKDQKFSGHISVRNQ